MASNLVTIEWTLAIGIMNDFVMPNFRILQPAHRQMVLMKRIKHYFPCIKRLESPMGDNVLEPKPRSSGSGYNTLSPSGLVNVNAKIHVISLLLYTFLSSTPGLNGNEALCCRDFMGMKPAASDWSTVSRITTR